MKATMRALAAGTVIELTDGQGGRTYDWQIRTDNLADPDQLFAASRLAVELVAHIDRVRDELPVVTDQLNALQTMLDHPRLFIAKRWQVAGTVTAAFARGVKRVALVTTHEQARVDLRDIHEAITGSHLHRDHVVLGDYSVRHVAVNEGALRGALFDVIVATPAALLVGTVMPDLVRSAAVTVSKPGPEREMAREAIRERTGSPADDGASS